jgi:signal transduction histidine kinase
MMHCRRWLALVALVYAALLVASAYGLRLPADSGIRARSVGGQAMVSWVMPASRAWDAGVRPGDLLPGDVPGPPTFQVSTGAGAVLLTPERWRLQAGVSVGALLVGGLILLTAGAVVLRTGGGRAACVLSLPLAIVGIGLSAIPATSAMRGWALTLVFGCVLAIGPAFLTVCWYFVPPQAPAHRFWLAYRTGIAALAAGATFLYLAALLTGGALYVGARWLEDACLTASVLAGSAVVLRWGRACPAMGKARGVRVVLLGLAAALLLLTGFIVGPHLLGVTLTSPRLVTIGLLLLPASCAFAVQHDHLLGLPTLWGRRLTRGLAATALAAAYLLVLSSVLPHFLPGASDDPFPPTIAAFVLGLSALPVAVGVARVGDRLIFRDAYSRHSAVRHLVGTIGEAQDVYGATEESLATVRSWLGLAWLAVLMRRDGIWTVLALASTIESDERSALAAMLVACPTGPCDDAPSLAATTTFPLHLGADTEAVLVAGPKANWEPRGHGDRDVLTVLATLLSAALARTNLLIALEQRVSELERHRKALRRLSRRVLVAQEAERKRIADDLHDGPLQIQHALLLELEGEASAGVCRALAAEAAVALRSACAALRPPVLDDLGLPRALAALARRREPQAGCPIVVECGGYTPGQLGETAELALYRIAQEALTNCAKHAQASEIEVRLQGGEHDVSLEVRDDGRGFCVPDSLGRSKGDGGEHFGLLQMQEWAGAWDGCLTIRSAPGQGALVRAVVPCAGKALL